MDRAYAESPTSSDDLQINPKAVDDLLSREMTQLSFQERSHIQEESHGVICLSPRETPEMLQTALQQLQFHLVVSIQHKPAFDLANSLPKTYINDPDFRLKFLRAELMDPWKAATRMVNFLELVNEFFGTDCLQRPVSLADIGMQASEALRSGQWQILPVRDKAGRRIMSLVNNMLFAYSLETRVKLAFYLMWASVQDIESQRKGLIFIIWPGTSPNEAVSAPGKTSPWNLPHPQEHIVGRRVFEALPIRPIAIHLCFQDDPTSRLIRAVVALILGRSNRSKIQIHSGERTEILYQLLGYGIPIELFPVTETGNVKTKNLRQWIKARRTLETPPTSATNNAAGRCIECPFINDVVFRFGTSYLCHPGNIMFLGIIESKSVEHSKASQEEKKSITWWVMDEVEKRRKGRFLSWNNQFEAWSLMPDRNQVRNKIAFAFREQKRRDAAQQNHQVTASSTSKFKNQDGKKRKRIGGVDTGCFCDS